MKSIKYLIVLLVLLTPVTQAHDSIITLKYGVDKSGIVTHQWVGHDQGNHLGNKKVLTSSQIEWADLIASRMRLWETQLSDIATPYKTVRIPKKVTVVVGNRGGRDAFTNPTKSPSNIFLNLSVLERSYGSAKTAKNENRIDRIFAHEFTHLLQHRWSKQNPYPLTSHVKRALNDSYKEGFGHFRSISNQWKDENGHITERAEKTLISLEKVFVERMVALKNATDEEASVYMKGLSTGPFNKKWDALTVALWLTKEADGDDEKLIKWVNLGPEGVVTLANIHLPQALKTQLNKAQLIN